MKWGSFVLGGLAGAAATVAISRRRKNWDFAMMSSGSAGAKLAAAADTAKAAMWALKTIAGRMGETNAKRKSAEMKPTPAQTAQADDGQAKSSVAQSSLHAEEPADLSIVQTMIELDPALKQTVEEITGASPASSATEKASAGGDTRVAADPSAMSSSRAEPGKNRQDPSDNRSF